MVDDPSSGTGGSAHGPLPPTFENTGDTPADTEQPDKELPGGVGSTHLPPLVEETAAAAQPAPPRPVTTFSEGTTPESSDTKYAGDVADSAPSSS